MASALSLISDFWGIVDGPVHPADEPVLQEQDPTATVLNRDYPPPAFIGDVDNAPILILMGNGGFDAQKTPLEFSDQGSIERYIQFLRCPGPVDPGLMSPYYDSHYAAPLIRTGTAAIVNCCAYRSNRLMNSAGKLKKLADELPSVRASRKWVKDELMPAAASGAKLVVVHRPGLWDIPPGDGPNFYQAVDPEWARKALPIRFRLLIEAFLNEGNSGARSRT
jgi:hypothetical protein